MIKMLLLRASQVSFLSLALSSNVYSSFYVGASAGHQSATVRKDTNVFFGAVRPATLNKSGGNAIVGSLYGGYGYLIPNRNLYVGIEAFASLSSLQTKQTQAYGLTSSLLKATLRDSYGLSIKPGFVFNNILGYLKIGGAFSNWSFKSSWILANVPDKTVKKYVPGFEAGIGFEVPLKQKLSFGIEYSSTFFTQTNVSNFSTAGQQISLHKIRPQTNNFSARITYKI
ncbi:MAG: porin family protein [Alphaproteobacteria bacterium]|nr:porin family protein [Alphaproteobacteria bacterium]